MPRLSIPDRRTRQRAMPSTPFDPGGLGFTVSKPAEAIDHLLGLFGERLYRFVSADLRAQGYDVHGVFLGHDDPSHPFERYYPGHLLHTRPAECILTVRVADTVPAFPKAAVRARRLTVGTAASIGFDKATGGNGALTCALDAASEGMAFDAAARTLSGMPGEAQAATTTPAPPRTRTATRRRRR